MKIKSIIICNRLSLRWRKFTNIAWKFFLLLSDKGHTLVYYQFLIYIFVRISHITTKNNDFLLSLLRISLFVYIACPPQWQDLRIRIFPHKLMTSVVTENVSLKKWNLNRWNFPQSKNSLTKNERLQRRIINSNRVKHFLNLLFFLIQMTVTIIPISKTNGTTTATIITVVL